MKKALLKKIPVVEAGIKDKQYMELCRQNYLMKVQKATVAHKRTLILNLYDAENIIKEQYQPFCRIFFSNRDFITYFIKENRWSIKTLDILEAEKGKFISQIAIRTYKEKRSIQQFFHCTDDAVDSIQLIQIEQQKRKAEKSLKRKKRSIKDIESLFRSVKPVTGRFEKWLEYEVLKESQYIFYQYSRRKMIDVLYGMLLPNIDEKIKLKFVSTDYLNELLDKVAKYCKSAGFKSRETLYIAMKDAQFLRLIDNNPVKATKTYPRPKRKITVLNKSQTRCFLTAAKERNWFLEIILGLYCGLRKGEILGLKFDDFDFEERTVTVQRQLVADIETKEGTYEIIKYQSILRDPKSESGKRRLKVPEIILVEVERRKDRIQLLKERMGEDFQDQNFISCQKNGNPRGLCSLNTEIRRLCERNGLPHITVHGLRHMYATILAERGVPLTKISALLGHHSVHTTFEFYLEVIEGGNQITDFLNKEFLAEEAAYGSK
ncbi:site-specific integrase [[Ruminococcus] torques]|uniref:site-specific integrase n=1 Tax=[Ruminococcus] torques TaxID=33039 RepID=UPI003FEE4673